MQRHNLKVDRLDLWRGEAWLVRDLSFLAAPGALVHVRGPNGCGKTTLLRALGGLTRPESGTISFGGRILDHDLLDFHSQLAWLGHRDGLKPELTTQENLRAYGRLAGYNRQQIDTALADAGLDGILDLPTRLLSAGQKRRAAIARVFASGAPLWILDEPLANLDADGRDWALRRVDEHVAEGGIVIITSHLSLSAANIVHIDLAR